VGLFGKFAYNSGRWSAGRPTAVPFVLIDVHDSRIATVDYRFADASGGRFYLGYEPRTYFEEPDAAGAVDTGLEAGGFVRWVREAEGGDVDPGDVQALMAAPDGAPPTDEQVEITVDRLLKLAGMPGIPWPTDDDEPAG
jgi:hypothetical protein